MRFASRNNLSVFTGAVLAVSLAAGAYAAEPAPSNIDLMTRLTNQVASDLYVKFSASVQNRTVEVRPLGNSEDYLFVANVFTSRFLQDGVTVARASQSFSSPPPQTGNAAVDSMSGATAAPGQGARMESAGADRPPQGGLVFQFQNVAFRVAYTDVHRSHLIGGKKVSRSASVRIFATLSDADSGRVLWTGEAEQTAADEFDSGEVARVEYGNYTFLQPGLPSGGWGKYAEPVLVTGIVVGLIYLFFANQSGN